MAEEEGQAVAEADETETETEDTLKDVIEVAIEDIGVLRKALTVTVPGERVNEERDKQYSDLITDVIVPGFRKGRAPRRLVEKRFGGEVGDQVLQRLVTNAYLHTGESKYRDWVLDYLQAWMERRDRNGGLMPDNVGPSGQIGELMNGKWWGGYYGWRWPHGARNIVEPALVAGSCALLMTGDCSWLDLARSQLDRLWDERRDVDGVPMVPARHGDQGWFDFRRPDPYLYIHLSYLSQQSEDRDRLETVFPDRSGFAQWPQDWGAGKAGICPPKPWSLFVEGRNDSYLCGVFESTARSIHHALDRLDADDTDPETRECYHFQPMNPVVPEALVQMTMGTPSAIYNGGLLQTHLCYFDPERRRPGLPQDVAALVSSVSADEARVELVNLDSLGSREVIIQAGSFGEHEFTRVAAEGGQERADADASSFTLHLEPGSAVSLHLGMRRFARPPSYTLPAELHR